LGSTFVPCLGISFVYGDSSIITLNIIKLYFVHVSIESLQSVETVTSVTSDVTASHFPFHQVPGHSAPCGDRDRARGAGAPKAGAPAPRAPKAGAPKAAPKAGLGDSSVLQGGG
jgi:hypothetical protein